jgi:ATP-dependent DNA ligase
LGQPLKERRWPLEIFFVQYLAQNPTFQLSPITRQIDIARGWLEMDSGRMDGIMAKRLDLTYQSGERTGMEKIKHMRTAD